MYAGCYIAVDGVLDGNTPVLHICDTEQELVDALLVDIGACMGGMTAETLTELSELLADYADNEKDCIVYSVK